MALEWTSWPARERGTSVRAGVFYVDRTMRLAQGPKLPDRRKKHAGGGHGQCCKVGDLCPSRCTPKLSKFPSIPPHELM